ncbi:MAG: hypothetical protein M3238_04675, partial [Actinomycetota bacterium]|nr:hypothetical protein [Actinomycetota bacterium]
LTLAALLWMVATGRRFGEAEDEARELAPPRRQYVDALATTLARTRRPVDAVEPVRTAARAALARRSGLSGDADERSLRAAASSFGLTEEETRAIFQPAAGRSDVLAVGRALTKLGGGSEW